MSYDESKIGSWLDMIVNVLSQAWTDCHINTSVNHQYGNATVKHLLGVIFKIVKTYSGHLFFKKLSSVFSKGNHVFVKN